MTERFTELSCEEFVRAAASAKPMPGGGCAAALTGALGVALGNMAGSFTRGKEKYAHIENEIRAMNDEAHELRETLLDLAQKDAEAFLPMSLAYKMPSDTDTQRQEKLSALQNALVKCCEAPLEMMRACCRAVALLEQYAEKSADIVISDAGCGASLVRAALEAAALCVFINTKAMKDTEAALGYNKRAREMLSEYSGRADKIYLKIAEKFRLAEEKGE